MRIRVGLVGSAVFFSLLSSLTAVAQQSHVGNLEGNAKRGKALYQRYCIFCHGQYGDGTGESAPYLDPKPRDFTKATFKCRSTPSGSLPLDSDLYDTISRGVHASGMPSWKPLLRQERVDLVAYIKTFSFDLTSGTRFKCGDSDQGLFRDLTTGLDGTPMPSFTDALKPDQIWDIVHYIHTLRAGAKGGPAVAQAEPKAE
jgi:mono/diheme cytochrome c family protein